jgi:phosphohistidine phosphatase
LQRAPDDARTVLLIGHNPGLGSFAVSLCGAGSSKALERMSAKFPTAALAVIDFDAERWSQIATGAGRLEAFIPPKDLVRS